MSLLSVVFAQSGVAARGRIYRVTGYSLGAYAKPLTRWRSTWWADSLVLMAPTPVPAYWAISAAGRASSRAGGLVARQPLRWAASRAVRSTRCGALGQPWLNHSVRTVSSAVAVRRPAT